MSSFEIITILPGRKAFYFAIHEIDVLAFGRENEANLVESLRKSPDFVRKISFVALKESRVVGYTIFSRITLQAENDIFPALALGPMAVQPELQNLGIGSRLVREGLERCRNLGHKIVVVVVTQNSICGLGSPQREEKDSKHHSLFRTMHLWSLGWLSRHWMMFRERLFILPHL